MIFFKLNKARASLQMKRHQFRNIVTSDGDFGHTPDLTVWESTDVALYALEQKSRDFMKPGNAGEEEVFINEIVETLRSVPKRRLRIVRDIVATLAEPAAPNKGPTKSKRKPRKSLLNTPFCGLWEGRTDIGNGRVYARTLRQRLERRGDRT